MEFSKKKKEKLFEFSVEIFSVLQTQLIYTQPVLDFSNLIFAKIRIVF